MTKLFVFFKTDYRIMQVKSISEWSQGAFCNTFDLHLAPICLKDLCCVQLLSKIFIDSDFCHKYLHILYSFECL